MTEIVTDSVITENTFKNRLGIYILAFRKSHLIIM